MGMRCAYRVNCSTAIYVELCDCDPSRKPPTNARGVRSFGPSTTVEASGASGSEAEGKEEEDAQGDARSATRSFVGILGADAFGSEEKAASKMRTKFERAAGQSKMRSMYAREKSRRL